MANRRIKSSDIPPKVGYTTGLFVVPSNDPQIKGPAKEFASDRKKGSVFSQYGNLSDKVIVMGAELWMTPGPAWASNSPGSRPAGNVPRS